VSQECRRLVDNIVFERKCGRFLGVEGMFKGGLFR